MNLRTRIGQLRILAIAEGISYLMFALTMPMKYIYEILLPNQIVGVVHGLLFILYCFWVLRVGVDKKWSVKVIFLGLLASLFPFATFVFDAKILKRIDE